MDGIVWYSDDEIIIKFDKVPLLNIRYVTPWDSEEEIEKINKKPFICLEELRVELIDLTVSETYNFTIPKDYTWDGATIPRIFWRLIGSKTDNRFLIPSLIHDVLCENHDYIENDRYFSTCVFERLLYISGVNGFNRWMIKHSVDNFQKIAGGWG